MRIAVFISGRGTNLKALLAAAAREDFPGEIALVISNRPDAPGLQFAKKAGVQQAVVDHKGFESREDFEAALNDALNHANIDLICLAGFMRILTEDFVNRWRGRMLNIHPSLLPAFRGLNVHDRMIAAGVKIAGCTVHFVSPEMDAGPIIGQASLTVPPTDNAETLAARILTLENELYPACLKMIVDKRARLSGSVVRIDEKLSHEAEVYNPIPISQQPD